MSQQSLIAGNGRYTLQPSAETFPFTCELSLAPLAAFWQQTVQLEHALERTLLTEVQKALLQAPALCDVIEDASILAQHQALIDVLMTAVFPRASWDETFGAALWPFHLQSFYATPQFNRLLLGEDGAIRGQSNIGETTQARTQYRFFHAYALILRRLYGLDIQVEYPLIYTIIDPDTGLDCHFKVQWDMRFVDIHTVGDMPPLTEAMRSTLLAHLGQCEVMMELLPPEQFVFRGFIVLHAIEVTESEVLSLLKRDLIDRESIISTARFHNLGDHLRTLFHQPDLSFSLVARQGEQVFLLDDGAQMEHHCIFADSKHYTMATLAGSVYERVLTQGKVLLIEDLAAYPQRSVMEEARLQQGIRSLVVAPLTYQDGVIGVLELRSPHPGALHAMNTIPLQEVLPLFAMAVRRGMEELNTRIQAVIKEECTAIHPAVEWRFRQAAMHWIEQRQRGGLVEMEPIVFDDVYPLYGMSDIRGSSTHRNSAIQRDLVAHLRLAQAIVQLAYDYRPLPILAELTFRVQAYITRLDTGLGASDETATIDFLRRAVEPVFAYLQTVHPEVQAQVEAYWALLNPRLGTLYQQRQAFEQSVTLLNEALATYLDAEEDKAQAMCPHYFELHKTDGIEYGIYIGASLLEHGTFDMLHVHNLRLWQLFVTCGIARQAEQVKGRLQVPLEMAHLILVQHTPLAVRFRFDEKRFDIDGAYNMRYEIVKKRIDKALIKGTSERLTQPGKIAIVYTQPQEAREYRDYITFLQASGHLATEVEAFDLEDEPGAHGLQALRVTVQMHPTEPLEDVTEARLEASLGLG